MDKKEINDLRNMLNDLTLTGDSLNRGRILELSQRLDKLIAKYQKQLIPEGRKADE